jgi:hypothetical protein
VAGFEVRDLASTMEDMRERGVVFEEYDLPSLKTDNGIAQLGPSRVAWVRDPDGNILALAQRG